MRKVLRNFLRILVGSEFGFFAEGNEQWYYALALAINCMLAWIFLPIVALPFTIISAIHFLSVYAFYIYDYVRKPKIVSKIYLILHGILFVLGLCFNWWWTLLTSVIVMIAILFAPDCVGANIVIDYQSGRVNDKRILICHTIAMVIYIILTCMFAIPVWAKITMIIGAIILHFLIDFLEQEFLNVVDIARKVIRDVFDEKNINDASEFIEE